LKAPLTSHRVGKAKRPFCFDLHSHVRTQEDYLPNPGQPTISRGATGDTVRRLQRALRRTPNLGIVIDGNFGPKTETAVKGFQQGAGLVADGIVGPLTWAALPNGGPMPILQQGATGSVVRSLQQVLTNGAPGQWNTMPGPPDGNFGPRTKASVEAFQTWSGITCNGVVGDATWAVPLHAASATLETAVGLQYADVYVLNFTMQAQQQSNWCWAAVSSSVSCFYDPSSSWTQCKVANAQLSRTDCCGAGASGPCNVYGYLDLGLTEVGHFDHFQVGTTAFAVLQNEIIGSRPFGIRVAWSGGGAHFIAAIGAEEGDLVLVGDPGSGTISLVDFTTLQTDYNGSGTWTHSYFTKL
jgi:peptidoglycan hydrolase-like protein with peptidoglycan-binding domain